VTFLAGSMEWRESAVVSALHVHADAAEVAHNIDATLKTGAGERRPTTKGGSLGVDVARRATQVLNHGHVALLASHQEW
jgi:hypothetical protein